MSFFDYVISFFRDGGPFLYLLVAIFGDAGRHARVATGAAELPRGAAVEIEVILAVS